MKDGKIVAVIFEAVAPDGYAGPIRLLVSVRSNGALSGVRVVGHKETPGLGDYIEVRKDRRRDKPWITQFSGRSLLDPVESAWKVKKDGGDFDANAGATVTPRAVVRAVHRALAHVNRQADTLFEVGVKP
jgi:electron transport complex protein RnfG